MWKEVHNREMSATTFWDKAKVNIITNLMVGSKPMQSDSILRFYQQHCGIIESGLVLWITMIDSYTHTIQSIEI